MNAPHTPGVWELDESEEGRLTIRADEEFITDLAVSRYVDQRDDPEALANGRRIVKCVNAHDELVGALREVLDLCELGDIDETTEALGWGKTYANALAVLEKAAQ